SAQAVAQASASGGPGVGRASVVRSSVAAGGSAAGAGRASPSGRLASAARASFTASPQASSDGGSCSLMTGLLTTDGPSDGTRTGVAASPVLRPQRGIGPEPDAQLALAQRRAVHGAAAQRGGEGDDAAERSGGDDDLVAAPDQVQLLAPGPRQGDVPDQDAVVGGGGPPARAEPGVGDAGDGPVDGGRGRAGARQGERAQVVGAARVPSEVGDGVDGVRLTPFGERLALLGDGPGQPAVLDVLGQHPAGDEAVGAQPAQGEAEGRGAYRVRPGRGGLGDQAHRGGRVRRDGLDGGELEGPAGGGPVRPAGGQRHPGEAAEHGPQGAGRLPFGREQAAQVAAEFTGEGEQGEGALGGREVDDEEVVLLRQGRVPQGAQQSELLGAGQRGQFVGLQAGGAEQVECGAGAVLQGGEVLPE